jgi:hypothetical protein
MVPELDTRYRYEVTEINKRLVALLTRVEVLLETSLLQYFIHYYLLLGTMFFKLFLFLTAICVVSAQIPCDAAYGQFCPEETGFGVGDCLLKQNLEALGEPCINFIQLHNTCKEDLLKHCPGKEYTGDALGKLTRRLLQRTYRYHLLFALSYCLFQTYTSVLIGMD